MATAQAAEVADLKQKLELADEDINLVNRRLDEAQGMFWAVSLCMYNNMSMKLRIIYWGMHNCRCAAAVETLRAELARAKEQARISNVAAKKAADELKAEQAARRQCEERISTMARKLKEDTVRCEFLEKDNKAKTADLDMALQGAREERSESRAAREEIRQAGEIAAGKPFLLQTKFGDPKYAPLNQMWGSPDAFLDLPKSVSDAAQFYQAQEGHATEKLFWSQFSMPKRPLFLNERWPSGPSSTRYPDLP